MTTDSGRREGGNLTAQPQSIGIPDALVERIALWLRRDAEWDPTDTGHRTLARHLLEAIGIGKVIEALRIGIYAVEDSEGYRRAAWLEMKAALALLENASPPLPGPPEASP